MSTFRTMLGTLIVSVVLIGGILLWGMLGWATYPLFAVAASIIFLVIRAVRAIREGVLRFSIADVVLFTTLLSLGAHSVTVPYWSYTQNCDVAFRVSVVRQEDKTPIPNATVTIRDAETDKLLTVSKANSLGIASITFAAERGIFVAVAYKRARLSPKHIVVHATTSSGDSGSATTDIECVDEHHGVAVPVKRRQPSSAELDGRLEP